MDSKASVDPPQAKATEEFKANEDEFSPTQIHFLHSTLSFIERFEEHVNLVGTSMKPVCVERNCGLEWLPWIPGTPHTIPSQQCFATDGKPTWSLKRCSLSEFSCTDFSFGELVITRNGREEETEKMASSSGHHDDDQGTTGERRQFVFGLFGSKILHGRS